MFLTNQEMSNEFLNWVSIKSSSQYLMCPPAALSTVQCILSDIPVLAVRSYTLASSQTQLGGHVVRRDLGVKGRSAVLPVSL